MRLELMRDMRDCGTVEENYLNMTVRCVVGSQVLYPLIRVVRPAGNAFKQIVDQKMI